MKMKIEITPVIRKGIVCFYLVLYNSDGFTISKHRFNTYEALEYYLNVVLNQKSPE